MKNIFQPIFFSFWLDFQSGTQLPTPNQKPDFKMWTRHRLSTWDPTFISEYYPGPNDQSKIQSQLLNQDSTSELRPDGNDWSKIQHWHPNLRPDIWTRIWISNKDPTPTLDTGPDLWIRIWPRHPILDPSLTPDIKPSFWTVIRPRFPTSTIDSGPKPDTWSRTQPQLWHSSEITTPTPNLEFDLECLPMRSLKARYIWMGSSQRGLQTFIRECYVVKDVPQVWRTCPNIMCGSLLLYSLCVGDRPAIHEH